MDLQIFLELVLLFLSMVVQVVVPPIPAELIVIAAGFNYGTAATTLFAGSGLLSGSILVFYFGRYLENRFAGFFRQDKVARVVERLRNFETSILWIRILPYNPADVISYAAGIIGVAPAKFMRISLVVCFARTWLLAYLGTKIGDFRMIFVVVSVLFLSWLVASALLYGRQQKNAPRLKK